MKKINKIIIGLLVALMLMTIASVSAFAASEAIYLDSELSKTYVDYKSGVTQYYYYKQSQTNSYLYKVTYSNMKNVTEVSLGLGYGYFNGRLKLYVGTTDVDGLYGNHYYGDLITSNNKIIYASDLPKTAGAKLSCLMDFEEITVNSKSAIVTVTCVSVNKSEWTWNGTSSASAKFTSTDGKAYVNVTSYATQTVVRAENCKSKDKNTYTVTVNFNGGTYTDTKTATGSAGPHMYTNSKCKYCSRVCYHGSKLVTVDAKAPTCTDFGWDAYQYCKECDYTTYVKIPADPDAHNIVTDQAVAAGCNNSGLTEGSHCSVCNKVLSAQQIIPANGHSEGDCVVENKTDSTCSSEGKYDAVIYCSACNVELSREIITIDKLPHTEVIDQAVEATCTNTGLTEGSHCKICGVVIKEQTEVKKTEHPYESVVTAPTCTEQGYTTYTCECGDSYVADYIDSLDHSFTKQIAEEEYFKSEATYASAAEYYYACERCLLKGDESYTVGEALKLGKPESVSATQTTDTINLKWTAVPEASGYRVFVRENNKWVQIKNSTNATEYTVSGLAAGTRYTYAVRAYVIEEGTVIWAPTFTKFVAATQPELIAAVTAKQTATTVTLTWDAVSCTGYRVFIYNIAEKKWDIVIKSVKTTTATITDLAEGTTYMFCVRPYVNTGSQIIWAKTYTALTTSTMLPAVTVRVLSSAAGRATIAWSKTVGATGYQVYYSTSPSGGYKKLSNFTTNSTYQYDLTSGTTYYYRVRAYRSVGGTYVYGAWSDVVSVKIK